MTFMRVPEDSFSAVTGTGAIASPFLQPRLVRIKQAATYLCMSPGKLRNLVQSGQIPVIRGESVYAPWLFDVRDLDRFIEQHKERL
jgi:hypothetical protein